jgi:uncharacterized coiled-coil DUF342 family protein
MSEASAARNAERDALVARMHVLHDTVRETRDESREIVSRTVEARIIREDQRARR